MNDSQYRCDICKGTFNKVSTDEEVDAEYRQTFPDAVARGDETATVCDNCYKVIMGGVEDDWLNSSHYDQFHAVLEEGLDEWIRDTKKFLADLDTTMTIGAIMTRLEGWDAESIATLAAFALIRLARSDV